MKKISTPTKKKRVTATKKQRVSDYIPDVDKKINRQAAKQQRTNAYGFGIGVG